MTGYNPKHKSAKSNNTAAYSECHQTPDTYCMLLSQACKATVITTCYFQAPLSSLLSFKLVNPSTGFRWVEIYLASQGFCTFWLYKPR